MHRLKKAVELINSLHTAKFPLLLSRIIQKLHLRVSAFSLVIFQLIYIDFSTFLELQCNYYNLSLLTFHL